MTRRPKQPLPTENLAPSAADVIVQVKVWLLGVNPMVWRRLLVPSGFTPRAAAKGLSPDPSASPHCPSLNSTGSRRPKPNASFWTMSASSIGPLPGHAGPPTTQAMSQDINRDTRKLSQSQRHEARIRSAAACPT